MRSFSEIDTVSKRASKAAGFSWGVAEEVGKNIRILEMFGLPGIKNLNDFYKNKKNNNFEKLTLISKNNKSSNLTFCPITLGTNFLDQIRSLENLKIITFEKVAYPLLLLPFISRASEVIGKRLYFKFEDKEFLLNFNNNIYSNFLKTEIIKLANTLSIEFIDNFNFFSENEWKEIYELSENTFVEESDNSKKAGAGAGLTDND